MKLKLIALTLGGVLVYGSGVSQLFNKKDRTGQTEYETTDISEQIPNLKKEAREKISPYRYDGSKTSYYIYKTFEQRKEVEVFFFSSNEYKMAFNGGAITDAIGVEIYDKPKNYGNRTRLFHKTGFGASSFEVTSTELLNALVKAKTMASGDGEVEGEMSEAQAKKLILKKVYINYILPAKEKEVRTGEDGQTIIVRTKGAVIMTMGYKNI